MEPPSLHGPCSHCIMLQVESFPADAPSSPRLLSFRLCASGVGSWFPFILPTSATVSNRPDAECLRSAGGVALPTIPEGRGRWVGCDALLTSF